MSKVLSAIAVALAAVALVVSFAIPGPTGPSGSPGETGLAGQMGLPGADGADGADGAGTIMAYTSILTLSPVVPIGATCTSYVGAGVGITVPGPGRVVVRGTTTVGLDHFMGNLTEADFYIGETNNQCTLSGWTTGAVVSNDEPTGTYTLSVPVLSAFSVNAAGTYSYFLNGEFVGGPADQGYWLNAGLIAVFYPT